MYRKRDIINKAFKLTEVYYQSRQIIFLPKQDITFLRFNINSQKMEITITDTKKETLKVCCCELLHKNNQTIRYVAKVIGLMVSSLPGVKYREAYYKYLERD